MCRLQLQAAGCTSTIARPRRPRTGTWQHVTRERTSWRVWSCLLTLGVWAVARVCGTGLCAEQPHPQPDTHTRIRYIHWMSGRGLPYFSCVWQCRFEREALNDYCVMKPLLQSRRCKKNQRLEPSGCSAVCSQAAAQGATRHFAGLHHSCGDARASLPRTVVCHWHSARLTNVLVPKRRPLGGLEARVGNQHL